jgi:phosphopantothenoylcysteine synthetase/decarboxylase
MAMRFLVTAGSTREMIDQVRDWGNIFTGNTGLAIARALSSAGRVDLLSGNEQHVAELAGSSSIRASLFHSHDQLKGALAALMAMESYDAVFMTAAVADYRPVRVYAVLSRQPYTADGAHERWMVQDVQAGKVKSSHAAIAVLGEPTEKLIDLFRTAWRYQGLLVKFKLEVNAAEDELIRIGQASRLSSGADYLVANTLEMTKGPNAGAFLLSNAGHEWVSRDELPSRLLMAARQSIQSPTAIS